MAFAEKRILPKDQFIKATETEIKIHEAISKTTWQGI